MTHASALAIVPRYLDAPPVLVNAWWGKAWLAYWLGGSDACRDLFAEMHAIGVAP